jgi:hypothetical protein
MRNNELFLFCLFVNVCFFFISAKNVLSFLPNVSFQQSKVYWPGRHRAGLFIGCTPDSYRKKNTHCVPLCICSVEHLMWCYSVAEADVGMPNTKMGHSER